MLAGPAQSGAPPPRFYIWPPQLPGGGLFLASVSVFHGRKDKQTNLRPLPAGAAQGAWPYRSGRSGPSTAEDRCTRSRCPCPRRSRPEHTAGTRTRPCLEDKRGSVLITTATARGRGLWQRYGGGAYLWRRWARTSPEDSGTRTPTGLRDTFPRWHRGWTHRRARLEAGKTGREVRGPRSGVRGQGSDSPISQFLPEYPSGQAQRYWSGSVFMQVPPFLQGRLVPQ